MHLWLKALHLIAMVAWFAGLFYMFRLFVYHVENRDRPETAAVLQVMAGRLYGNEALLQRIAELVTEAAY